MRNRTKADRQSASAEKIKYDVSYPGDPQQREAGRGSGKRPVRRQTLPSARAAAASTRGTLGPSGLPLLRTSERGTFKRCRWLYKLEYIDRLKPNTDSPPLMFGSMIHIALAGYYKKGIKRGPHPAGLFERAVLAEAERVAGLTGANAGRILESWQDRVEMGVGMMNNYVDTYGKDDEWKVLATELPFKVIVNHPKRGNNVTPWFWYTGILDLLIESRRTGLKRIRDHKTTAAIQTKYLAIDDQTTSYWTYGVPALQQAGHLGPTEVPDGLEFNLLRKAKPDERPFRIEPNGAGVPTKYFLNNPTKACPEGEISKKQPAPYFHREVMHRQQFEMEMTKRRVVSEFLDMEAVRREPEAAAYKNPTKWTCPGCWAFDACELHEVGADYQAVLNATTHEWDPYEAHEIYFGEAR